MKKLSAEEDFRLNTIGKMSGCLTKAEYVASLLDENGDLSHWGMERTHGAEPARAAMKSAYDEQMQALLRTSLRDLWEQEERLGEKIATKDVLLTRMRKAIEAGGGKPLNEIQISHLKTVLDALFEVASHDQKNQGA
jgi:hypothetical protein